jgi:hypothetical protein
MPETSFAQKIAEQYRNKGFDVVSEPGVAQLPFDLHGYLPDFIARKNGHGVIVDVKKDPRRISVDSLREIAREIRRHDGWRFVLHTPQDVPDLISDEPFADPGEFPDRINRAIRLMEQGNAEAAFLTLWIVFERGLRMKSVAMSLPVERLDASLIIPQLYSLGELSVEQYRTAEECCAIRNRVIHGFSVPQLAHATERLLNLIREVLQEWSKEDK